MTPNLVQTAKIRRLVLIERKRLREEMLAMRASRSSRLQEPVKERWHRQSRPKNQYIAGGV